MRNSDEQFLRQGRRAFLRNGTLFLAATAIVDAASLMADEGKDRLRIGLITDLHHADKASAGTRHYRETLGKLAEAAAQFEKDEPTFIVHFVVLDACFRNDGQPYGRKNSKWNDANIPAPEMEWLQADLKVTGRKTVVFAHQRLDVSNDHGVKNCADVRRLLEESGKVLAVFQGHSHQNDLKDIGGIHYCTLVAMIEGSGAENNGYSMLEISPDDSIRLTGFRTQKGYLFRDSELGASVASPQMYQSG